uniref:5-demethoxyubiquinone hydroxylase, mitochondrial n=1 Tax=Mola mola TaxID=94237 RepID=A0A3Q3W601_MOLML
MLDRILRVDHAGEYGANRIYAGQMAVLGRTRIGPLIQEMWDQEKKHLAKFNEILAESRVRPTALLPLWNIAGFALGASTALLGKECAMACTVAVEESISEHYNSQIRALMEKDPERYTELLHVIKEFRDDEMEHHDTGLEHEAETVPGYWLIKNAIQLGCKVAIYASERV